MTGSPLFATKHRLLFSALTIWVLLCSVAVLGLDARLIKRRAFSSGSVILLLILFKVPSLRGTSS